MTDSSGAPGRTAARRGSWFAETMRIKPAKLPVGRSLRAAITVGGPMVVGSLTDHVFVGLWIALAGLLITAGERAGTYRLNFSIIAVAGPIAAMGYALGFIGDIPLATLIIVMTLLALLMGLIAGLGPAFSFGGMQFLLFSSIAIGLKGVDWWQPLGLYFVGAVLYAALLAVEMLLAPRLPQREALESMLRALAALARARAGDLADGGDRTAGSHVAATAAYDLAVVRMAEFAPHGLGADSGWALDADVLSAAERVKACLLGEREPAAAAAAAADLEALADSLAADGPRGAPVGGETGTDSSLLDARLGDLARALHPESHGGSTGRPQTRIPTISPETVFAAVRIALCFGIAVGAKAYFPFDHWFWVPLTVCLVMKPDFGSVFSRAVLRVSGTVAGAALATVVILLIPKGVGFGIIIAVLAFLVPWTAMRSYALESAAITGIVVLLVATVTPGDHDNLSWQRIAATAIGGALAIVFGYLIWPSTRRGWVHQPFIQAMNAIAAYLQIAGTDIPDEAGARGYRHDDLVAARLSATQTLSGMRTRLHRDLGEPRPVDTAAQTWLPVVEAADQLATAVTAYAVDRAAGAAAPDPQGTAAIAAAIRDIGRGGPPTPVGDFDTDLEPVSGALARLRGALPVS